jgi:hypothetical protein
MATKNSNAWESCGAQHTSGRTCWKRAGHEGEHEAPTEGPSLRWGAAAPHWPEEFAAWPGAFRELVQRFRPLYEAEIARVAATLRARFESGELRAITDEDLEDGDSGATSPMWRIEAAVGEHFRLLQPGSREEICEGAGHIAHMILAVSPSASYTEGAGWHCDAYWASAAATWDVILYAREQGWYAPGATEQLGRSYEEEQALKAVRAA